MPLPPLEMHEIPRRFAMPDPPSPGSSRFKISSGFQHVPAFPDRLAAIPEATPSLAAHDAVPVHRPSAGSPRPCTMAVPRLDVWFFRGWGSRGSPTKTQNQRKKLPIEMMSAQIAVICCAYLPFFFFDCTMSPPGPFGLNDVHGKEVPWNVHH